MIFKPAAAALLAVLGFALPALADYSRMTEELETYSPPGFFKRFVDNTGEIPQESRGPEIPEAFDRAVEQVRAMKAAQEGQAENFMFVRPSRPPEAMTKVAENDAATAGRLKNRVRLEEVRILAALRHPAVSAARREVRAALAAYDQVTGLDETVLAYQGVTRGVNPKAGPVPMKGSIGSSWPLPSGTALKGRIVTADVQMAKIRQAIVEKKTVTLASRAYWDLALVDESTVITRETITALSRLKDVAAALYRSGKTGFQDIARINIRLAKLSENLVTLGAKRDSVSVRLAEVLSLAPETPMGPVAPATGLKKAAEPAPLYKVALAHRQELLLIRQKIDKLSHMVELGESMANRPFTLGLSFYENDLVSSRGSSGPTGAFPEKTMAAMKNSQPVNAFNSVAQPWLDQTRQNLEALKLSLGAGENAAVRMVRDAWFSVDKNRREMQLYKNEIIPLSKSALDVSTREYEAGAIGFADAISAYTDWLEARLALAEKRSGLGKAIAVLEQMTGTQL